MHVVSEDHAINRDRRARVRYVGFTALVGALLLLNALGIFDSFLGLDTALLLTLVAGYKTFYRAISELLDRRISADLAIVVAAVAATLVGEYLAAAEAMFIMLVGEGLEAWAAGRAEAAIHRFVDQLPRRARVLRDGTEIEVAVEELVPGDVVVVRAGERIAADGVVETGQTSVDESPITGESMPRDKAPGDEVFSGTLNGHGLIRVRVDRAAEESTLARLIRLVEEARDHRAAPVVRLADRYARWFLPAVLLIAAGVWLRSETDGVMRAVTVLIVACPCALILATPAAMVAAIGGLARRGILARGGAVLQTGSTIDTVVFDKTGTLTTGKFQVAAIAPAAGFGEDDVLRIAAAAEAGSDHPLARVIVETARARGLDGEAASEARIVPGRGAQCVIAGRRAAAGNLAFLAENDVEVPQTHLDEADRAGATAVLVALDGAFAGSLLLRDTLREGAAEAVREIEALGIHRVVLLTGDRRKAADAIAREAGIQHVEAELLPEQKLDRIRRLQLEGRKVAMIGDGVNDAPALAAADVGVAVAGSGADIAAEAADVVDLNPTLEKLPKLFSVSRRAVGVIWQNIILFAGAVNVASVYLAGVGSLGPVSGAVVHQISSILVMLNSVRLLRIEPRRGTAARWARWTGRPGLAAVRREVLGALGRVDPAAAFAWLWERRREALKPAGAALAAVWLSTALVVIEADEIGVIERLGRKLDAHLEPGLGLKAPFPVDRLRRVRAQRARVVEIGFRTADPAAVAAPAAFEWNAQHRGGRIRPIEDESAMLTGDQNMVEMTAVVHYRVGRLDDFLYRQSDPEAAVRVAAESALGAAVNATSLDELLTTGRRKVEERAAADLQSRLDRYRVGVEIMALKIQDLHPSVEVVDAFREAAAALEDKSRLINEAEAYRNEQVALARGRADARVSTARGYDVARVARAAGEAARFTQLEAAHRRAPGPNATRLYLETMEEILAGREKLILDGGKGGRRTLFTVEDGVLLAPPGAALGQPPPPMFQGPEEP